MVTPEAMNLFHDIITHEMFEMNRILEEVQQVTLSNLASRGLTQSGPAMQLVIQNATNSLKTRAQFILGQLLRCLASFHVPLDKETITEALSLLRDTIEMQADDIGRRVYQYPVFSIRGLEQAKHQLQAQYAQEGPRLIDRLSAELKLAAAASQNSRPQGAPSFTFHGPIGLVQTGDGSQATVRQHINTDVKNQITTALQLFLDQLDMPDSNSIGNRTELRELIAEAKAEVEKPECNTLKLGSSLRTIAETTKFVGSLAPAYSVLKPLISYLGIHLP
ncbi:hypothetical protein [Beijerinckia indica]|uniref:Uncharacterized protein n=1 Tax=Beijerinckia indica subsp. indica (strain ATCC 9039 / DSM 1715 / NCIMB 8712) TaxID=395963 RepID=B2ILD3_BEII9|nr:hypothetical protein [Beijerinckia indica]ACB97333.1 hypothetical protein Bind_3789 [Beijerinckia indica subsp. indica ATCC 9039]